MTVKVPLVLLVIALALALYIVVFERGRPGASELASRAGFILDQVVMDRVDEIRVVDGENEIVIERMGEGLDATWTIVEPVRLPADDDQIADFLGSWEYAAPLRRVQTAADEDLGRFGLDAPKSKVCFASGSTAAVEVLLGSGQPVDGAAYVRIDDRREVMVIDDDVARLFDRTLDELKADPDAGAPDLDDLE